MDKSLIDRTIVKGKQSLELVAYYTLSEFNKDAKKIKIVVKRDAYDFQSIAVSYLFTDDGWKDVYSIPYQQMDSVVKDLSPYAPTLSKLTASLLFDERKVLGFTETILG